MSNFQCQKCGTWKNRILETRAQNQKISLDQIAIVRRMQNCQSCGHVWTTIKVNETEETTIIPPIVKEVADLEQNFFEKNHLPPLQEKGGFVRIKY